MARIRSIKPEFWEDEKIGCLTPNARLLFVGTWNLADDEGLLRWTEDYMNASLFMYDDLTIRRVRALMDEVTSAGLVFPYAGKSAQKLGYVVNFRKHQKINRPQPGKFPPPSLQNQAVQDMYGERDRWLCHLCGGAINRQAVIIFDPYEGSRNIKGSPDLNLSMDHLTPRSRGGSDYPSNISAAHIACNKGRRDKDIAEFVVPESVKRALNHSVNGSVNQAPKPDAAPDEPFTTPSAGARADQGAGSREQGKEVPPPAGGPAAAAAGSVVEVWPSEVGASDIDPDSVGGLIGGWLQSCAERPPPQIVSRVGKHVKELHANQIAPRHIRAGLELWRAKGADPSTLASFVNQAMNSGGGTAASKPSTTDQRVRDNLAVAARFAPASATPATFTAATGGTP